MSEFLPSRSATEAGPAVGPTTDRAMDSTTVNRAVERALLILETLAANPAPVHLSKLARTTGYPKSTVHRLLRSLVSHGFALRTGHKYTIGFRLLGLAYEATSPNSLSRDLMPFLLELYERTRGTISLGVLSRGHQVRYSDALHGRGYVSVARRSPDGVPAHCTAAGKLLFAYDQSVLRAVDASALAKMTAFTITEIDQLHAELREIRRRGIAYAREEYRLGEVELAVPVFDARGKVLAGLTVAGRAQHIDLATAATVAQQTAYAASVHLRERAAAFQPRPDDSTPSSCTPPLNFRRSKRYA
jgi:DNA-binding IclR family transcriptional regulator